jgi:hypothetical protein
MCIKDLLSQSSRSYGAFLNPKESLDFLNKISDANGRNQDINRLEHKIDCEVFK